MLRAQGLLGGAVYFDAATDDSRLTLANVVGAAEAGAAVLNYAEVAELIVGTGGRAIGALAADALGGERTAVGARVIVNATGPWTDAVHRLESQSSPPSILGSKGAHIAVPRSRVGNRWAVTLLHPVDGRVMFALPSGDHTIFGTTETAADSGPSEVLADRQDVAYVLAAANAYFPSAALGDQDVVAAWAGIRPLAAGLAAGDAGSASREHAITVGASGVLHVTGGKLTTYRAMAEEVVDQVVDAVGQPLVQRCRTAQLPLPGGDYSALDALREEAAATIVSAPTREHLLTSYGSRWRDVWEYAQRDPVLAEPITPELPYVGAQFAHAAEHEMALSLGDLLVRRTHAAFQLPDHGRGIASRVATIVAPLLSWDSRRVDGELRAYDEEVRRTFG
jgi:glycerol-3-phosphate dehydrogenase